MKKIFLIIVGLLLVGLMLSACTPKQPSTTDKTNDSPLVGGDKDEHGCIGSAGYSWCESNQKCLRSWEENCTSTELSK